MVANSGRIVGKLDAGLSNSFGSIANARTKKRLKGERARDFYRMAASLATFDIEEEAEKEKFSEDMPHDLALSNLLDSSHQEKSPVFIAEPNSPPVSLNASSIQALISKMQDAFAIDASSIEPIIKRKTSLTLGNLKSGVMRNNVYFSPREITMLMTMMGENIVNTLLRCHSSYERASFDPLSAADFHGLYGDVITGEDRFILCFLANGNQQHFLADRARLFSSHRMRLKSLQQNSGTDPYTNYFHAALRSANTDDKFDITYWLKFDDERHVREGGFIDLPHNVVLNGLFSPNEVIEHLCIRRSHPSTRAQKISPVLAVLQLYYDAQKNDALANPRLSNTLSLTR